MSQLPHGTVTFLFTDIEGGGTGKSRLSLQRGGHGLRPAGRSSIMNGGGEYAMWDESRRRRFEQLRKAKGQDSLSETERAELAALIQERCRAEETAIVEAAQRGEEANARLEAQLRQVQAQNRELETLIQEQEAYLAEVQATIAGMEERRRDWRERYQKLTGKALNDPVTTPRGG